MGGEKGTRESRKTHFGAKKTRKINVRGLRESFTGSKEIY